MNTLDYDVELQDGAVKRYKAKIISNTILCQCNPDRYYMTIMESITDHKCGGSAIPKSDKYYNMKQGTKRQQFTTIGWQFLVKWKDGRKSWVKLRDLNKSNPMDLSKYATDRGVKYKLIVYWIVMKNKSSELTRLD